MKARLAFLAAGLALGSGVTWLLTTPDAPQAAFEAPVERTLERRETMSVRAAETLRETRYEAITTIEQMLELPGDFAQTEALYVVAGRADSAELQDLIYQAAQIRERLDRQGALQILFLRLTEIDPQSAVAIARSPAFRNETNIEHFVWESWGRLDLDAALAAASGGSSAERRIAAEALYGSLRGLSAARAEDIESALGIAPTNQSKAQQLFVIADDSPAEAIAYIESLRSPAAQREHIGWLAFHLSRTIGPDEALRYAGLIGNAMYRTAFEMAVSQNRAQRDPAAVLARLQSGRLNDSDRRVAAMAFQQLAASDIEQAISMFAGFEDRSMRETIAQTLAQALAERDPQRALVWARENDRYDQRLTMTVLAKMAEADPSAALLEAQTLTSRAKQVEAANMIFSRVANSDPAMAAELVSMAGDLPNRQGILNQIAAQWAAQDVEAAFDWLETIDVPNRQQLLATVGQRLALTDLDAAIRVVDRLPLNETAAMRQAIASRMAQQRSPAEAEQFIARYANQPDYSDLVATVAVQMFDADPAGARRFAQRITNARVRGQLEEQLISRQAISDPEGAIRALDTISDESARSTATYNVVQQWHRQDPAAATAWVRRLPRGQVRDQSLSAIITMGNMPAADVELLIDEISAPEVREAARMTALYQLSRTDPAAARRLMESIDLTPEQRQQILGLLDRGM